MRKTTAAFAFVAALTTTGLLAGSAHAAILASDTFSNPNGTVLNGKAADVGGPWATFSGTAGQMTVNNGSINVVQTTQSEDIALPFAGGATAGAGTVLYAGFDLTVPTLTTVSDGYFAQFLQGTSNFDARVWLTAGATSGYRLALSNDNSITDNDGEVRTGDLQFGTTYRVVTSYSFDAKQGTIWINPTSSSSASATASDPGFADASYAYSFREASAGSNLENIDNVIIATTFDEVVPEPTTLAALGGAAAFGLIRRRSR